jgi:hypothetical protein
METFDNASQHNGNAQWKNTESSFYDVAFLVGALVIADPRPTYSRTEQKILQRANGWGTGFNDGMHAAIGLGY